MVGGKEVAGPGISNKEALILGMFPLASYIMSRNPISEKAKGPGLFSTPGWNVGDPRSMSYLGGLSYTNPDAKNEQVFASLANADAFKAWKKHMEDLGVIPTPKFKPGHSAFDNWLRRYLHSTTTRGSV